MKTITKDIKKDNTGSDFDPFRLISDEEFSRNLGAIVAYYQMTKGETKRRFVSSSNYKNTVYIDDEESF